MFGFFSMSASKAASAVSDAAKYLIMKLSGEGYNKDNNKVFLDESNNYFGPITTNGNAAQGSAGPFGTNWSWYFDGNGDWLSAANSSALNLSGGDFTIEAWINLSALASTNIDGIRVANIVIYGSSTVNQGYSLYINQTANSIVLQSPGTGNGFGASFTFALNTWYHVAATRSGSTDRLFVNGVSLTLSGSSTFPNNSSATGTLKIGSERLYANYNHDFPGYISNLRIVKGTALYTANFTPSTAALTNISGTSLLTCQNGYLYDNSNNRFTLTANGDAQSRPFGPFAPSEVSVLPYRSVFFDGTGDYLTQATNAAYGYGTGDFTIEFWLSMSSVAADQTIVSNLTAANGTNPHFYFKTADKRIYYYTASADRITGDVLNPNIWYHIALSRSSGSTRLFVNGVQFGSTYADTNNYGSTAPLGIGTYWAGASPFTTSTLNGYISNLRIVKGTAVYTANFTPPTSPLSAIANTSILTCQGNTFGDSSSNNFTLTTAGDTRVTANSPFSLSTTTTTTTAVSQSWSGFFDGSGDTLTAPAGSAFAYGTGDFTVEAWIYPTATNASNAVLFSQTVSGTNYFSLWFNANQTISFIGTASGGGTAINGPTTVSLNTWSHVAVVRNSGTVTVYVNGVGGTGTSNTTNFNNTTYVPTIASYTHAGTNNYTGYISNLRVVNGTAVYTGNFTPPTSNLTAIANTSLLTLQGPRFIDSSSNNFAITQNGDARTTMFGPYLSTGSMFFDGTGDYINYGGQSAFAFGTGDFTVETWYYASSIAAPHILFDTRPTNTEGAYFALFRLLSNNTINVWINAAIAITSTTVIAAGRWYHVAVSRQGTTMRLFINGALEATVTNSTNFLNGASRPIIGADGFAVANGNLNGYLSNLRVVKGTAVYTAAFTPPTANLTNIANTSLLLQGVNNFTDTSSNNFTPTLNGNVSIHRNDNGLPLSPYANNYSVQFSGSNYLSVPSSAGLNLDSSDFTIECWFYPTGTPSASGHTLFAKRATGAAYTAVQIAFVSNLTPQLYVSTNGSTWGISNPTASISCTLNNWNHVAVTRFGDNYRLFINGQVSVAATLSGSLMTNADAFTIGAGAANGASPITASYISNFRVVKGTALYTTTFTPPTSALTAVSGTTLLTCQSNRFIDNSSVAATITAVSSPTVVNAFDPYDNLYSYFFNGSSDYITSTASNLYAFGTGDFTVEAWIYQTARTSPAGTNVNQIVGPHTAGTGANWILYTNNAGNLLFYITTGANTSVATFTSTSTIPLNQWVHVAAARSGGTLRLFLNGADAGGSGASAQNVGTNYNLGIGAANNGNGTFFSGHISNVRITKGTALYTSAFTPSTAPLTTSAQTVLLTGQGNSFTDASGNNVLLTTVSTVRTDPFTPFRNTISSTTTTTSGTLLSGSYFFDGSGDYLSIPANSAFVVAANEDFTIEFWWRPTVLPAAANAILTNGWPTQAASGFLFYWDNVTSRFGYFSSSNGSTWDVANNVAIINSPRVNQWYHIAVSRRNGVVRLFGNGVMTSTFNSTAAMFSTTLYAVTVGAGVNGGSAATGFVSNLRILRGAGLYTNNFTPPTTPGQTLGSSSLTLNFRAAGIYDSVSDTIFETLGDAAISTVQKYNGNTSMFFDGTGDYLTATNRELAWNTGDFTVEFWMYSADVSSATQRGPLQTSTTAGGLVNTYTTGLTLIQGTNRANGNLNGGLIAIVAGTNVGSNSVVLTANTWTHVAVVRASGTVTLYINGTSVDSRTAAGSITATNIAVGGYFSTAYLYSGYLDDLQIYSGYAKYTGNFTPT